MPLSSNATVPRLRYHIDAYEFVFDALRHAQASLNRVSVAAETDENDEDEAHITGPELLEGIRKLALKQYGLMPDKGVDHFTKIVAGKQLWNYDNLEPTEKKLIL